MGEIRNSKERRLRIIYVGPLQPGDTCLHRMEALRSIGHDVVGLDTTHRAQVGSARIARALRRRLIGPSDSTRVNERIIEASNAGMDVLWIDKGLTVRTETLHEVRRRHPGAILLSYSPDDMMNPQNQSSDYLDCLPIYDLHVTTKSFNVPELLAAGARNAVMVDNGYSEDVHRPITLSAEERKRLGGPIGCVAFWEKDRERLVTHLARNELRVRVWGPWPRRVYHPNLKVEGVRAWAEDYPRVISAFDINLGFLRKANRDQQTTRSVEIPACAAFMLAERSEEHLRLFEEGEEAEFFDTDDELLDKTRYYLAHSAARERIAAAGRDRCLRSGYGNRFRMLEVLNHVWSLAGV